MDALWLMSALIGLVLALRMPQARAELQPMNRHSLSVQLGAFQLKSSTSTLSSIGALTLQYGYRFADRWSVAAAYQAFLQTSGTSSINGFDIGARYCLLRCGPVRSDAEGIAEMIETPRFGLALGAGFGQRSFQLATQSVGFSGIFGTLTANYYLSPQMKILSSLQLMKLSNGANHLDAQIFSAGVGFDF